MASEAKVASEAQRDQRRSRANPRLIALLAILIGVGALALTQPFQQASGSARAGCPGSGPAALRVSRSALASSVVASGITSLPGDGVVDVEGPQDPGVAWSDAPPPSPEDPAGAHRVPAGYEIRWWSALNGHRAVDLFLFHNAGDARAYVRLAASRRCRPGAVAFAVTEPAGGRALVWTNPERYLQADVFFSKGNRVYRIVEVATGMSGRRPSQVHIAPLVRIPQVLACWLKDASCATLGRGASD